MFPFWLFSEKGEREPDLHTNLRAFKAVALLVILVGVIFSVIYLVMYWKGML